MKTTIRTTVGLAALAAMMTLAPGCASRQDVQTLDQRNRQTMQEARELFKQLEEQIAVAREEARKSSAPVQAKQADIWAEVESLKTEVATLKGQMDTMNMRLAPQGGVDMAQLDERVKAIELALESQFAVDLGKGAKAAATAPTAPAQAQQSQAQATPAQNAKAVLAYDDVINKHKDSPKYRSALLKQGISFYKMGKDKPGKIILQELIDKNPGTAEANRAKQFLADPKK